MTTKTINKGYVTYININDRDPLDRQITIKFDNVDKLDDIIQLIINNGFNAHCNKVNSIKVNDTYYLNGYDKAINIINQIINGNWCKSN